MSSTTAPVPVIMETFYLTIKKKGEREEYFPTFPIQFFLIFHWKESNHMTLKESEILFLFWIPMCPGNIFKDSVIRSRNEQVLGEANHLPNSNDGELWAFNHQWTIACIIKPKSPLRLLITELISYFFQRTNISSIKSMCRYSTGNKKGKQTSDP